jgi:hypothetical protein
MKARASLSGKRPNHSNDVIPAQAGIHFVRNVDPRFRGGDVVTFISTGGPQAHVHSA